MEFTYQKPSETFTYIRAGQVSEQSQVLFCKLSALLVILWKCWTMLNKIPVSQEEAIYRYMKQLENVTGRLSCIDGLE